MLPSVLFTLQSKVDGTVASGEGFAHDLTPLVPARAGKQWSVAGECEETELAVIEKRQNEANLLVVLTIGIL
jgi:hypothetical protein